MKDIKVRKGKLAKPTKVHKMKDDDFIRALSEYSGLPMKFLHDFEEEYFKSKKES